MKRVLSLVLALVLVLGMMPTFAASATGAEELKAYGFVSGGDNGDLMVDKSLTRAEMAVILSQLYGVKDKAEAYVAPANFTDVNDHWAKSYIAYGQEAGWFGGYPDNTYRPDATVSAQELAAYTLNALGYNGDYDFASADQFAATLGINVGSDKAVTRGEAFESLWTTVNTPKKGSEVSLGVELGKLPSDTPAVGDLAVERLYSDNLKQINVEFNQAVDKDSAIDKENYTLKDNKDKKLISKDVIENIDLSADEKTVTITLKKPAEQQDTYKVTIADVKTADESKTVIKSEKEMQFVDTQLPKILNAEVAGSNTIKVTFSEPMDVDSTTAVETAVKKAFKVNDGKYYVKDVEGQKNNTEILVTLYTTLKAGDLPFQVTTDIKDFAGFSAIGETYNLPVVEDTTAPVVTGFKSATRTEVVLIWSEDIKLNSTDYDKFYHTNANNAVKYPDPDNAGSFLTKVPESAVDGNELTLEFDVDHKLAPGSAYVYVLKDAVKDLWGNKNSQQMTSVEVDVDKTAPELSTIEYTDTNKVKLTFNEKVNTKDVTEKDDITLLDNEGKEVDARATVSEVTADKSFTITFKTDDDLDGDYSLVIEGVKDTSDNEMAKTTIPFTAEDKVAPSFPDEEDITLNTLDGGNTFVISVGYGEKMATEGRYSVLDLNNYVLKVGTKDIQLGEADDVTINLTNEGKAVEIRIPKDNELLGEKAPVYYGTETPTPAASVSLTSSKLTIARVADDSDNVTVALSSSAYSIIDKKGTSVKITKVEVTDPYKVKITLDSDLSQGNFDKDDFTLYNGNSADANTKLTVSDIEPDFDGTKTTVVFNIGEKYDNSNKDAFDGFDNDAINNKSRVLTVVVAKQAGADKLNSYDVYENPVESYDGTNQVMLAVDKSAPVLETSKLNGTDEEQDVQVYSFASEDPITSKTVYRNFVVLHFNENIDSSSLSTTTFAVDDTSIDKAVVVGSVNTPGSNNVDELDEFLGLSNEVGHYVVLQLATDEAIDEDTTVTLTSSIYDLAGSTSADHNSIATLKDDSNDTTINKVVLNTETDLAAPVVTGITITSFASGTAGFGNDADNTETLAIAFDRDVKTSFDTATAPTAAEVNALLGTSFTDATFSANDLSLTAGGTLTLTCTGADSSVVLNVGDTIKVKSVSTVKNIYGEKLTAKDVTIQP